MKLAAWWLPWSALAFGFGFIVWAYSSLLLHCEWAARPWMMVLPFVGRSCGRRRRGCVGWSGRYVVMDPQDGGWHFLDGFVVICCSRLLLVVWLLLLRLLVGCVVSRCARR